MNQKILIGLSGASGKMGQEICKLTQVEKEFQISATHDSKNPLDQWEAEKINTVIDFSLPPVLSSVLKWCQQYKKPLVSGTTGFKDNSELQKASHHIPILWAPNMSLGIACLNEWLNTLPPALKSWNIQVEEIHHKFKKDKPSGTARLLQETLKKGGFQPREPLSERIGDIQGIHKVTLASPEEVLLLKHTALDRKVFAKGALQAARWILPQPPGLYSLKDCLQKHETNFFT